MAIATITYILTTVTPQILDVFLPLNETRPKRLASHVEYFFNWENHFHYIVLHICITCAVQFAVISGCRATFSVFTDHACGLFANIG